MNVLTELKRPQSAVFTLQTLTPLYTGGIGQQGEQLHPSGLLGGIRRFSTLLAVALGDSEFEYAVWGTPTDAKNHHAKGVGLHLDSSGLHRINLPGQINWERPDGQRRQGWFYNVAHDGALSLTVTRRRVSDHHWRLLLLALRIQIRHATLGAKDQFGLGVLTAEELPAVEPLDAPVGDPLPDRPGLHRAFFAEVVFDTPLPKGWPARLEQGLRWREKLRGSLRQPGLDDLRHYVFGQLNQHGNAVNVSALYPHAQGCALRIWGVLPHTAPPRFADRRDQVMAALQQALQQGPEQALAGARRWHWRDAAAHPQDFVNLINTLAGVAK